MIFCLPSTAKGGRESRIVPSLSPGSPVTTPRADIDFIVSEFGIAELAGKTVQEKAQAIIEIAGPGYRAELQSYVNR